MAEPLSDALFRYVAGRSPKWESDYKPSWVTRAVKEAGSQNKLAAALGVARATVQGWVKGAIPSLESQELLRVALRRAGLSDAREAKLLAATRITITGDQDGRARNITLDERYLYPGTIGAVVAAYLRGASPIEMQVVFWRGIHDSDWYKTQFYPGGPQRAAEALAAATDPITPAKGAPGAGGGAGGGVDPFGSMRIPYEDLSDLAYEGEMVDYEIGDSGTVAVTGVH